MKKKSHRYPPKDIEEVLRDFRKLCPVHKFSKAEVSLINCRFEWLLRFFGAAKNMEKWHLSA